MKVNIIDHIGEHCGMHYYNEAFQNTISNSSNVEVQVFSNYTPDKEKKPFFLNQYKGATLLKLIKLLFNYLKLFSYVIFHRNEVYICLSYGIKFDILFIYIASFAKKSIVDIHEVVAKNEDDNDRLKSIFRYIYNKKVGAVISHSEKTSNYLKDFGYSKTILEVPHFKYCFKKDCNESVVGQDVLTAISDNKINLLFFGTLSLEKGVDIFIDSINKLDIGWNTKINAIIAGKNADDAVYSITPENPDVVKFIIRHISDDELVYFYQKCDYVVLPYRNSYQSGVLEMAFYFKKPIITSNIIYFTKTLSEFPSFGIISDGDDAESFVRAIKQVVNNHNLNNYFIDCEYDNYTNRKEIDDFVNQLNSWLIK